MVKLGNFFISAKINVKLLLLKYKFCNNARFFISARINLLINV